MNQCNFIGYVTHNVELKTTQSGIFVCEFDMGIPRIKRSANQETVWDYITVVAWRERAEFCARYLTKGTKLRVTTTLKTDSYEDKNGIKRKKYTFELDEVEFCERKQQQSPSTVAQDAQGDANYIGQGISRRTQKRPKTGLQAPQESSKQFQKTMCFRFDRR